MNDQQDRLMEIFNEARAKASAEERDAYLTAACGDDAALRRQVETLLQAHTELGDFLKPPGDDPPPTDMRLETTGNYIGRYKLLQQIGEGAFGVVFMAEQTEPVHRKVALKIIKAGMDTRQVVARFEAERQALALMDHPNIARVLDAGATEAGRPYFVMELVKGLPITKYADQYNLPTADRLRLFMQVCQGVQHAHQKGIIHRDLKPHNILVTIIDGQPVPKIIDFGVAKALGQRLTDKTLFTAFEQIIGTPAYMSPEQAELSGVDIDTRSDIYSLGVLLYELLTGVTPFDEEALHQAALDEVRRIIRETEPAKPSTRLRTLGEKAMEIAQHRHVDAVTLTRLVHGDLDWIVMKALEKDRRRRYETASAVAEDLQRHRDHQPVHAGPPSAAYRARKFVRRHRMGVALGASVTLALIVGLAAALVGFNEARHERDQAEKERDRAVAAEQRAGANEQRALTEATRSAQVAQFMKEMLKAAGPSVARGRDATLLKEVLERAAERVRTDLEDQPEVQGDLWYTLGTTFQDMGEHTRAISMLDKAAADFRLALGDKNKNLALALGNLGYSQSYSGNVAAGSNNAYLGLTIARKSGDPDTLASCLHLAAKSLGGLGTISAAGEPLMREAVEIRRKLGKDPVALADCLSTWGATKWPYDETIIREALDLYRKHLDPDHKSIGGALFVIGQVLQEQNRYREAEPIYREATERMSAVWDKNDPYQPLVRIFFAQTLLKNGKPEEAEMVLREGIKDGLPVYHRSAYVFWLTETLNRLRKWNELEGLLQPHTTKLRERLQNLRAQYGDKAPQLERPLASLTQIMIDVHNFPEAEPLARECLAIREKRIPNNWLTFNARSMLGGSLLGQKKYAEAEPLLLSGYEGLKQREAEIPADAADKANLPNTLRRLVQLYEATDRPAQAAEWKQKLADFEKAETEKLTEPAP